MECLFAEQTLKLASRYCDIVLLYFIQKISKEWPFRLSMEPFAEATRNASDGRYARFSQFLFDDVNRVWPCVLGPVQHKGLDFVPMRTGLPLPVPVAIVLGSLCLPPRSDSSCAFVLVVTVFQLIRVVGEIEYLAQDVSVTCATLRPLVMNGILSLNVLRFMICVLGMTACLGPVSI